MQVRKQLHLLDHYLQESNWTEYRKEIQYQLKKEAGGGIYEKTG